MTESTGQLNWPAILNRAAELVRQVDGGCTLRQLFYLCVSEGLFPNRLASYKGLSHHSAIARRDGTFPALLDQTRRVRRYPTWESPAAARKWLVAIYRVDRTAGQPHNIVLGIEKATLVEQFVNWFGDYGFPIVPCQGYSSQTLTDAVAALCDDDGRPGVLIYVGDHDPSGVDIQRDFALRVDGFDEVIRVAILPEHVEAYGLTPFPGKASDSRAAGFEARFGELVQVEVEAMAPNVLRSLVEQAIGRYHDRPAFEACVRREFAERATLMTVDDDDDDDA